MGNPNNPLQCKLANVTPADLWLQWEVVLATLFAVNNFDNEWMMQLVEPAQGGEGGLAGSRSEEEKGNQAI